MAKVVVPPPVVRSSKPKTTLLATPKNEKQNEKQRQKPDNHSQKTVLASSFSPVSQNKAKSKIQQVNQKPKPNKKEDDEKTLPQENVTESDEREEEQEQEQEEEQEQEQEKPTKKRKQQNQRPVQEMKTKKKRESNEQQEEEKASPPRFKVSSSGFGSAYSLKNKTQGGKQTNKVAQKQSNKSRMNQSLPKKRKPVVLDEIEEISYLGFNPDDYQEDPLYYFPASGINVEDIQKRGFDLTDLEFFDRVLWPERDSRGNIRVRSEQKGKHIVKTIIHLRHPMSIAPSERGSKPFFPVVWFLPNARSATSCAIQTAKVEKNGTEEEFFTCAFNLVLGWVNGDQSHVTNYYFTFFSSLEDWNSNLVKNNQDIFETGKKTHYHSSFVDFVTKFDKKTQKEKTYPPKIPFKIKFRRPYEPNSDPEILWNEIKFIRNRQVLKDVDEITEAGFFDWQFKTCISCVEVVMEGYSVTNLGVFGRYIVSRIAMTKPPRPRLRQAENSDFDNLLGELSTETEEAEIEDKKKENTFAGGPGTSFNRERVNRHATSKQQQKQAQSPEKHEKAKRQEREQGKNQKTRLPNKIPAKMVSFKGGIGKLPIPGSVGAKKNNIKEPTKKQKKTVETKEEVEEDVESVQDMDHTPIEEEPEPEPEPEDVISQGDIESQQTETETGVDLENSQLESKESQSPKRKKTKGSLLKEDNPPSENQETSKNEPAKTIATEELSPNIATELSSLQKETVGLEDKSNLPVSSPSKLISS